MYCIVKFINDYNKSMYTTRSFLYLHYRISLFKVRYMVEGDRMPKIWDGFIKLLSILFFIGLALLPFSSRLAEPLKSHSSAAFILITLYYAVIIILIGFNVSGGNILAILIDRRNMVSLSKLQMAIWTILVISGFVTIAALKTAFQIPNPLDIGIPETLWVLMGISTASFIGSPLLKNENFKLSDKEKEEIEKRVQTETNDWKTKNGRDPNDEEKAQIRKKVEEDVIKKLQTKSGIKSDDPQELIGTEVANKDAKDASIFDIFRGEEVGNFKLPDLGKIQMFLFSIIVWAAYAMLVYQLITRITNVGSDPHMIEELAKNAISANEALRNASMNTLHSMTDFPDISGGMTALLGISNAGYLAYKGIPREDKKVG